MPRYSKSTPPEKVRVGYRPSELGRTHGAEPQEPATMATLPKPTLSVHVTRMTQKSHTRTQINV